MATKKVLIDLEVTGQTTATKFISNVSTGQAPYQTNSSTLNPNLNADLLDGKHASEFATQTALNLRLYLPTYYIDENTELNDLKYQGQYLFIEGVNVTIGSISAFFTPSSCKLVVESFSDETLDNWLNVRQTLWDGQVSYTRYYDDETNSWTTFKNITPPITDHLTSTSTESPLSAKQGKVLKDLIDAGSGGGTSVNQVLRINQILY
jgi:hypothetical protein